MTTKSPSPSAQDLAAFEAAAPLAKVLIHACSALDQETEMVASRAALSELQRAATQKRDWLLRHDSWVDKILDPQAFAGNLSPTARVKLKALYGRFAQALQRNKQRLSAALEVSQQLLVELAEAAASGQPRLYTRSARLTEAPSAPISSVKDL